MVVFLDQGLSLSLSGWFIPSLIGIYALIFIYIVVAYEDKKEIEE